MMAERCAAARQRKGGVMNRTEAGMDKPGQCTDDAARNIWRTGRNAGESAALHADLVRRLALMEASLQAHGTAGTIVVPYDGMPSGDGPGHRRLPDGTWAEMEPPGLEVLP